MLNTHKRSFHSSQVKFPLVSVSANWFWLSTYLIWILGSKLIRSKNQSRATLWVLDTCLIVGLLHLRIILITASWSSNTYNKTSWWERLDVWKNKVNMIQNIDHSMRLWIVWGADANFSVLFGSDACFRERQQSDPINRWAGIPSNLNPASKEMISDSVELCETEVCFLHIQLLGTKVWLPKTHEVPTRSIFRVLNISRQNRSLETVPTCIVLKCYPHDNTVGTFTCVMDVWNQSIQSFVTGFGPISWSIVQVCSRTIKNQVFQFVPNMSISEQFESILLTSLQQISILLLWNGWWSSMHGVDTL